MKKGDKKLLLEYIENHLKISTRGSFYINLTDKMYKYIVKLIKKDLKVKK